MMPKYITNQRWICSERIATPDRASLSRIWHNIAAIMIDLGDYVGAEDLLQKSLITKEEIGDVSGIGASLSSLGRVYLGIGQI